MDSKELQRQFRAAAWDGPEQMEEFARASHPLPVAETLKLLALLSESRNQNDALAQRSRLLVFRKIVEASPDAGLFLPFVRAFRAADSGLRTLLADLLPIVNSVPGHGELAALLKQPEPGVRKLAARVMKQISGKSMFEQVFPLAREDHPGRLDAMELAAQIGGYHAIPVLEHAFIEGKTPEKLLALKHLGDPQLMAKDVPRALAAISRGVSDPLEAVVAPAITAFAQLCTEDEYHARIAGFCDSSMSTIVRAAIDGARRFATPRTFALLERRFRMGPNWVRIAIINTLDAMGGDESLPLLVEALTSKNVQVRTRAGEVLSNLSINHKVNLSRMAIDVAKRVGDPSGDLWPSLLKFLRDEDWWVRERVIDALVDMAGTALTRHIVGYLQDQSDVVRRYAVDVLMRLKDPAALGALVRCMMTDTDWWVRERAMEAAALLKDDRTIPYFVELIGKFPELRISGFASLAVQKATSAANVVAAYVADPDVDVGIAALACLEVIGAPSFEAQVQRVVSDSDHRVRARARGLLAKWSCEQTPIDGTALTTALTTLDHLLVELSKVEGDDLLLAAGRVPYVKRLGKVEPLASATAMDGEAMKQLLWPILTEPQRTAISESKDIDFSYEVKGEGLRFRANVFRQTRGLAAVFRIVKDKLLSIETLGLPAVVQTFGDLKNGLVLVGGPTGSGKSTTLAAIIDYINRTSARHIVSLEDPIEIRHARKQSLVNQREVGTHTRTFANALRSVLREDPDVILVGEMRDLATISFAVTAAETGHLVFGTLHTVSADTTMDRLINAFPAGQQNQVRSMLAESIRAVVCQHLLRRANGPGRVLAVEVMTNNDAISNLIRKGKCFQIPSIIATQREAGMQLMDGELKRLLREGLISADEAYMKANSKKDFEESNGAREVGNSGQWPRPSPLGRPGTSQTLSAVPGKTGQTIAPVSPAPARGGSTVAPGASPFAPPRTGSTGSTSSGPPSRPTLAPAAASTVATIPPPGRAEAKPVPTGTTRTFNR
jgi:twitching motility protein PilT